MKKTLLALAVGAVAALPVSALANGPTLYGQIDLSVENVNVDADTTGATLDGETPSADNSWVLRDNSSRLGVKGEAETDVDGLSGIYKAEFGLEADDGSSVFDQRNIYVGLKSDSLGTLKMGNFDTPFKTAQGSVDQFNDGTLDMANIVANETRASNIVEYSSPTIADMLTVNVAVTTEEVGTGSATSMSVVYDKDGLYLAVAADNDIQNDSADFSPSGLVQGLTMTAPPPPLAVVNTGETDALRAVVGWSTEGLELGFLYQTSEQTTDRDTGTPVDVEDTSMLLSAALKAGKWKVKAQAGQTEGDDGDSATKKDEVVSTMAFGIDYALGQRTTAYAIVGTEETKHSDDNRDVAGVGLRHKF